LAVSINRGVSTHDDLVATVQRLGETGLTVKPLLDEEPIVLQQVRHRPGQVVVVLDDEHSSAVFAHCK
jgi:hypothetical protein